MIRFALWGCIYASVCLMGAAVPLHPLYLSLTELRYDPDSGHTQLGVRLFTDDLEDAIRLKQGTSLPIEGKLDQARVKAAIQQYVLDKVSVSSFQGSWELKELKAENEATWIAFEGKLPLHLKNLHLTNQLLLEVFDTQKNLVKIYRGAEMKAAQLNKKKTRVFFEW